MSREKNTDLTDCTDIGGAVRHCPPPVRQIRKIRNQKKAGIVSSEKITDLTDCTDLGGAVRHRPPPVRQIRKIRNQK